MNKRSLLQNYLTLFTSLGKIRITIPVALTAFTGYLVYKGTWDAGVLWPAIGVFFLATGSSAFNHYQEKKYDARMNRTRKRPIPSGRISAFHTYILAFLLCLTGALILYFKTNETAFVIGLITLVWYNLIYTYLKRITAFAVIPGSIIGALPPIIGWTAADGAWYDTRILALAFFFFIGQIPHFWLLLIEYGKEYEQAGFPTLTRIFSRTQLKNLTFIWILASAISALVLPLYHTLTGEISIILLIFSTIFLILFYLYELSPLRKELNARRSFVIINIFYLFVMLLLCTENIV